MSQSTRTSDKFVGGRGAVFLIMLQVAVLSCDALATKGRGTFYFFGSWQQTRRQPLATIERAREAVRQSPRRGKEGVVVYFCSGTYRLTEPLTFTAEDSGAPEAPITYAARPGELSGGVHA